MCGWNEDSYGASRPRWGHRAGRKHDGVGLSGHVKGLGLYSENKDKSSKIVRKGMTWLN